MLKPSKTFFNPRDTRYGIGMTALAIIVVALVAALLASLMTCVCSASGFVSRSSTLRSRFPRSASKEANRLSTSARVFSVFACSFNKSSTWRASDHA